MSSLSFVSVNGLFSIPPTAVTMGPPTGTQSGLREAIRDKKWLDVGNFLIGRNPIDYNGAPLKWLR